MDLHAGAAGEAVEQIDAGGIAEAAQGHRLHDFGMAEILITRAQGSANEDQPRRSRQKSVLEQGGRVIGTQCLGAAGDDEGSEIAARLVDQECPQGHLGVALDCAAEEIADAAAVEQIGPVRDDIGAVGGRQGRIGLRSDGFQSGSGPDRRTRNWCARIPIAVVASIGHAHICRSSA